VQAISGATLVAASQKRFLLRDWLSAGRIRVRASWKRLQALMQ